MGRSILAIALGFVTVVVLSLGADVAMRGLGVFPAKPSAMSVGLFALATLYRAVFTVLGGALNGGVLVANPIPAEWAMPREVIDAAITAALADAAAQGITGKAITPFLLDRVNQRTGGGSLAASVAVAFAATG